MGRELDRDGVGPSDSPRTGAAEVPRPRLDQFNGVVVRIPILVVCSAAPFLVGCCNPARSPAESEYAFADELASGLEEYGTITMSNPILSRPDARFEFGLKRTADDFFEAAKEETQGGAALFDQTLSSFRAALDVRYDPLTAAAAAENLALQKERNQVISAAARLEFESRMEAARAITDPTERASAMKAAREEYASAIQSLDVKAGGSTSTPGQPPDTAELAKVLAESKFVAFQGLMAALKVDPKLTDRSAMSTAAGDVAVRAIFELLGKPAQAQEFRDKRVFFAVSMVSVTPGWRTREGFAAELMVTPEIMYGSARPETLQRFLADGEVPAALRAQIAQSEGVPAHWQPPEVSRARAALERWSHDALPERLRGEVLDGKDVAAQSAAKHRIIPTVSAISPMTEGQSLDLASSIRQRSDLALSLAGVLGMSGGSAAGQALQQYIAQRERDVRTRNLDVAVATYSAGSVFGFQVGPTLWGLGDPARGEAPAYRLGRQSFPVLMVCGVSPTSLGVKVFTEGGRPRLFEPHLKFTQMPRWVPLDECAADHRLTEDRRFRWADAQKAHAEALRSNPDLRFRVDAMSNLTLGSTCWQTLPFELVNGPARARIRLASPAAIELGGDGPADVDVRLTGDELSALRRAKGEVTVVTGAATLRGPVELDGDALVVPLAVRGHSEPIVLGFSVAGGGPELVLSPKIPVREMERDEFEVLILEVEDHDTKTQRNRASRPGRR